VPLSFRPRAAAVPPGSGRNGGKFGRPAADRIF
jgi:hypothetical protein